MSAYKPDTARDGQAKSPWQTAAPSFHDINQLRSTVTYDTIIVGGGITGITTALLLQKAGQNCVVVEAGNIGFGTTGGTTAHLNTFFDATYPEIESDFGEEGAKLVAQSGKEAMDLIKSFIDTYQIDCDFEYKMGYLYSETEKESKQLEEILAASRRAGIDVIEYEDNGVPVLFDQAIMFKNQGQFHPLKYINGLLHEFVNLGGTILENTFITDAEFENGRHKVSSEKISLTAKHLVYATHLPPGITKFSFTCAPYRSYVLGVKLKNDDYPIGLSYDMQEPYHYFRTHEIEGQPYLIIGGSDHKTGHEDPVAAFMDLEEYTRKHYEVETVDYKWSSQYYVPVDGLPYIGDNGNQTFIATGYNGNGMMFGTLAGKIISDEILGIENPYTSLYSPSRIKPIAGFSEFVKENADVAYHFVADRFSKEELDSISDLEPGQGLITEIHNKKAAVYKHPNGEITALSPVCTHAGCIVKFNSVEKSWDCPCHGGRFDVYGKVITGPPRRDLEKIER